MNHSILVSNVSKKYNLGERQKYLALRDVLRELPGRILGRGKKTDSNSDFWALKNLDFTVEQGETLGIIGRNGAGKSTLLKILSQITPPTTGEIRINGRVGSLLEVGTGFHPELTGRENVYLNGAILGMRKKEIDAKFDEIVEFSGIGKFLDTPVKRYSSGMYVRLAFAVAAHLEPDILIIDEVLAVGDVEFQKKCLGKMEDITKKKGRTILFVSHNLGAVERLCSKTLLLENGTVKALGPTKDVIAQYMSDITNLSSNDIELEPKKDAAISFSRIALRDEQNAPTNNFNVTQKIIMNISFEVREKLSNAEVSMSLRNSKGIDIMFSSLSDSHDFHFYQFEPGNYSADIEVPANFLMPDLYYVRVSAHYPGVENIDTREDVLSFRVSVKNSFREINYGLGCVINNATWDIHKAS